MITYLYETVPSGNGEEPKVYEIRQPMGAPALTHHPESGERLRRIIAGGAGIRTTRKSESARPSGSCGCGHGGCGCH
ncbi:zinc ribbon domain-containing protein [Methylacidimicrobium sp. AP8]|uniref:zinc ribbon domain-containing protein n=1 Tax=Methylacidimicrobium sp. AP8 TaxID=2730359 RepID=UPI001924D54B|nr:zinc ribbon domain-containing protein [Methylacidimicrobium sp. AP8]